VSAGDAAPDGAELGTPHLVLGLVDEAHALAEVKINITLLLDVLDLEERGVLVLVAKTPLETHHHALCVQPVHTSKMRDGDNKARRGRISEQLGPDALKAKAPKATSRESDTTHVLIHSFFALHADPGFANIASTLRASRSFELRMASCNFWL
jgi:hypothetical protein